MKEKPSISFVLPMFNEEDNIVNSISTLRTLADQLTDDYEIVVVDDASSDKSVALVEALQKDSKDIALYKLPENTKFGGAFAKGFASAEKDVIMYMDSDMPVSMVDILESFPLIKEYDIVTGCSKVKKGDSLKRKIISGSYNLLVQILFGLNVRDINSGYKIVRRDLIDGMRFISKSPFVDVELFLQAKRKQAKVKPFPLVFISRTGGKSYISSLPIILATFRDMLRVRFTPKR